MRALLFFLFMALAPAVVSAEEVCIFERTDGKVAVIRPNWKRYTTNPAEAGPGKKTLIVLDEFCLGEAIKQPDLIGRQPFHDKKEDGMDEALREPRKWLQKNPGHPFSGKLAPAKQAAEALKHRIMDKSLLPGQRTHPRRDAWRVRTGPDGKLEVFDDVTVTVPPRPR